MRWWRAYVEWFEEIRRRQGWDPGKSTPAERVALGGVGALLLTSVVLALRGHYWAPVWFFVGANALCFVVVRVQYQRMGPRRRRR